MKSWRSILIIRGYLMSEKITMGVDLDKEDLMLCLCNNLSHEEIIEFIIKLEKSYEDWGVTEKLYKYFKSQKKIFDEECREFEDYSDDWDVK